MPRTKKTIEVNVANRSGSNLSHRNSGTLTCGTLTPLLIEEVIPGTRMYLKIPEVVQLPPLVSDTYMNLKLKHEAFFVPFRLLCSSFEDFFADFPQTIGIYSDAFRKYDVKAAMPVFDFNSDAPSALYGAGSLLDYLGLKISEIGTGVSISPMSLAAYHLVWQDYYRNPRVQNPAFVKERHYQTTTSTIPRIPSLIYTPFNYASGGVPAAYRFNVRANNVSAFNLADGVSIFSLRQRNFGLDWFTGARPTPQQGQAASVSLSLPEGATETSFTISQLRAANSLQQFRERNNLPSPRMVDQVRARYGAHLSDGVAQRPICIGSSTFDVVTRSVDQTANNAAPASGGNPFDSVGSNYGKGYAVGDSVLIEDFTANEPGFVLVLQSLVPEVTYSSGIAPYLRRYMSEGSIVEMATPLLQNIGDEPIYVTQLFDRVDQTDVIFGYNDRYGTFMFHSNEVHGLLRDGQTLEHFVLQRGFGASPTFGSAFLEIPKNFLDQVFVANEAIAGFSAWYDAKLDWRISHPLAESSIPSLQDPAYEHGHTVSLHRNGQIF